MSKLADAITDAIEHGNQQGLIDVIPYCQYLGIKVLDNGGDLIYKLPFRQDLIGNAQLPAIHGGVTAAFMENSALLHLMLKQDKMQRIPKTVNFSIDYLRSARALDCFARCKVKRQGRRVAMVEIKVWQQNPDQPVAAARAHFLLEEAAAIEVHDL